MADAEDKQLTKYQQLKAQKKQKEFPCGQMHASIEQALVHAEIGLGMRAKNNVLIAKLEPYIGSTKFGSGTIVGWQSDNQRRFRLDFDPEFEKHNAESLKDTEPVNKGTQGVHINEENFTRNERQKICHPTECSLIQAELYWNKWSREFGVRGAIKSENIKR